MKILGLTKEDINIKQNFPEFISLLSTDKVKGYIKNRQVEELAESFSKGNFAAICYLLSYINELDFASELLRYHYNKYLFTKILNLKIDELVIDNEIVLTAEECVFNEVRFEDYVSPYSNTALKDFNFIYCVIDKLIIKNSLIDVSNESIINYYKLQGTSIKEIIRI